MPELRLHYTTIGAPSGEPVILLHGTGGAGASFLTDAARIARPRLSADANDVLFQFESAADYNPKPNLARITARVLAINSSDDERNPPEVGEMEQAMKRLKSGRYVLLPITADSRGHGTTANAHLWKQYLAEVLQ